MIFNSCALFQPSRNHKIVDPTELLLSKLEKIFLRIQNILMQITEKNFVYKPIYGRTNSFSSENDDIKNVDIKTSPYQTIYE